MAPRKSGKKNARRRQRKGNQPGHTPLDQMKKRGTALRGKLADLPSLSLQNWSRDALPEHLWVGALSTLVDREVNLYKPLTALTEALAPYISDGGPPFVGFISDFGRLKDRGTEIRAAHGALLDDVFVKPIGRALAFYPECPAAWAWEGSRFISEQSLDPEVELPKLRRLVVDLFDRTGSLATAARMAMFREILKSGKLSFLQDETVEDLIEVLCRYPDNCTEDERGMAESSVRAIMSGAPMMMFTHLQGCTWPKSFWQKNHKLLLCRRVLLPVQGAKLIEESAVEQLKYSASQNIKAAKEYIDSLTDKLEFDLYGPERQETLAGLFSRVVRLYALLLEDPRLWARDTAGIVLRCLTETTITFCYLAKKGTVEEFAAFRAYGDGQKKLLMLQLQDNHPDQTSLEGRTASDIAGELGGFTAELLQIELGNWAKKDTRKLAYEAGLEDFYRLVFTPTSSDVHGTWASLKDSNLAACGEPLHRFHQLPSFSSPPLYVHTLIVAQDLLARCYETAVADVGYPEGLSLVPLLDSEDGDQ